VLFYIIACVAVSFAASTSIFFLLQHPGSLLRFLFTFLMVDFSFLQAKCSV
jgi:hypothetical protein